jgi:signal transduction histidine kinase/ActR/RegA family two-component response regulator
MAPGQFTPHGYCLAWDPTLVWLSVTSDFLIALAYYSIPAALLVIARRREDLVFRPVFYLFAAFIMACGTTHLLGMISVWIPLYWTEAIVLAITAALSLTTATILWPLMPRFLALPSPRQLQDLNAQLAAQIAERDAAALHLRESEERLRQAQKMAAIGQLTGGIAHDFNNILQGISSGVELMRRRIVKGRYDEALNFVDAARENIGRAGTLVQGLLAFARRQPLDPKPLQLNELALSFVTLLQQAIGPAIDLEVRIGADTWPVHCDPNQLESALVNLAINARDAMPAAGGTITIETENVILSETELAAADGVRAGRFVRLTMRDTGTGMSPDVVEHAFEPFFTTKPAGQGTGLGLSQVFGFVTQSNGVLKLESQVGHGTSVHLFLPTSDENPTNAAVKGSTAPPSEDIVVAASVMLVDDEPHVRAFASAALQEAGCTVTEAPDAAAALALIRNQINADGAKTDILVTDIGLPGGLNGRQLADAARALLPDLPVVLVTGYAGDAISVPAGPAGKMIVLRKPFELDELVKIVMNLTRSR